MKEKKLLKGGKIFSKTFRKIKTPFNYLDIIYRIDLINKKRYLVSMASNEPKEPKEPKEIELISISSTEIQIGDYITLKLEQGRTNIYVKGRLFTQCKYILINVPNSPISEEIDNIDDAKRLLSNAHENKKSLIDPESEFWGHASNLQAWVEHGYDTRIIHSNLGFPLLVELTNAGDPLARIALKEEIFLRLESGSPTVTKYLINEEFYKYLKVDEFDLLTDNSLFVETFIDGGFYKHIHPRFLESIFATEYAKNSIIKLELENKELKILPRSLTNLINLKTLLLHNNQIKILPPNLSELKDLEYIDLSKNKLIKLPDSIGSLKKLQHLNISENLLTSLPKSIGDLSSLHTLLFHNNQITTLPDSIGSLIQLSTIDGTKNQLISIPNPFFELENLEAIHLSNNQITSISEEINLPKLLYLSLDNNLIKTLPHNLNNLTEISNLTLNANLIKELPENLELPKLQVLNLNSNNLSEIPKCISNFGTLATLLLSHNDITEINDSIQSLSKLSRINLESNKIKQVPPFLLEMLKLVHVNLKYNEIESISEPLLRSNILSLKGNPLSTELYTQIAIVESSNVMDLKKLQSDFNNAQNGCEIARKLTQINVHLIMVETENDTIYYIARNEEIAKDIARKRAKEDLNCEVNEGIVYFGKERLQLFLNKEKMENALQIEFNDLSYDQWDEFFTQEEILDELNLELEEGIILKDVFDRDIYNSLYDTDLYKTRMKEYVDSILSSSLSNLEIHFPDLYKKYLDSSALINETIKINGWGGILDIDGNEYELPNGRVYWKEKEINHLYLSYNYWGSK